jgi:serine/threonine protein kinase
VPGKSKFRLIDFGNSTRIIGSQYESDLEKDVRNLLRTRTDYVTGTPGYIAPEQVNLSAAGCKEDWWALGSTLYHLLTGKVIFEDQGNKATNFTNFMMVHSGEMNYEDLEKLRQDLYSISPLNSDYLDAVSNLLSPDIADRNLRKASQISDDLLQGRIPLYRSQMDDSSRVPLRMRAVGLPTRVSNRVKFSSQSVWT